MDAEAAKLIGAGITAIGMGAALAEGLGIFAFVVALILIFVA
jgi:F0F1-type ATP synthase membrane subunit c/vacuolar-type H+-ATPase subunit K